MEEGRWSFEKIDYFIACSRYRAESSPVVGPPADGRTRHGTQAARVDRARPIPSSGLEAGLRKRGRGVEAVLTSLTGRRRIRGSYAAQGFEPDSGFACSVSVKRPHSSHCCRHCGAQAPDAQAQ